MATTWMSWDESPWISRQSAHASLLQLTDRLLQAAAVASGRSAWLEQSLPQLAMELGASGSGVLRRSPDWQMVAGQGTTPRWQELGTLLVEVLDRDAAAFQRSTDGLDRLLAIPLCVRTGEVLILGGQRLEETQLAAGLALGRLVSRLLVILEQRESDGTRLERLRGILSLVPVFAQLRETQPLLERIAEEATRLMSCDRASIFLWDRDQHQLVACPALGAEGGRLWLSDRKGIVGEVVQTGKTICVPDAYADPRFDPEVDKASGYRTRNLLCAPLVDGTGERVGAFELINRHEGSFTAADEEALSDLGLQVATAVQNARERDELIRSNRQLTEQVVSGVQIIGDSPPLTALRDTIRRLAATDLPVLILGESGTGKEVAAQTLHFQGPRSEKPFVAVNCAALAETLLESELFGHEKGAFTDAHDTRAGKFELADGGTLFLDEIGDMSPGGQAKLLRVLEQKVITRVGGSQSIPINVRVIAATNANLVEAVRARRFREDLYYRLSVVTLEIPALRDRPEDVQPLAEHFLKHFCRQANRKELTLSAEARRRLQAHGWPGNVRELRNLMERLAFLAPGERVEVDDLSFILSPDHDPLETFDLDLPLAQATIQFQQEFIRRAIKRVRGNMSESARLLGLHRSNLYRKMRQLDMDTGDEEA